MITVEHFPYEHGQPQTAPGGIYEPPPFTGHNDEDSMVHKDVRDKHDGRDYEGDWTVWDTRLECLSETESLQEHLNKRNIMS